MAMFVTPPKFHKFLNKTRPIKTSLLIPDTIDEVLRLIENKYINPVICIQCLDGFAYEITKHDYQKILAAGGIQICPQNLLPSLTSNLG